MENLTNVAPIDRKVPIDPSIMGLWDYEMKMEKTFLQLAQTGFDYWSALGGYHEDFLLSYLKAVKYFHREESGKFNSDSPIRAIPEYAELMRFNLDLALQAITRSTGVLLDYHQAEADRLMAAIESTLKGSSDGDIFDYIERVSDTVRAVARDYPQAIREIADEFGFHFERSGYRKVGETERFYCYQVLPNEPDVEIRKNGKPILIVHPYVLGADILAFLPRDNKSYAHAFANQGIPTYVRILKDIETNSAVQQITLEDDIRDMKRFCETIKQRHGRDVTLNGYCQGGLITLSNILSGELDGLVDAHISCVAPLDGSRSPGFKDFLGNLPNRFNSLAYGTKVLPNGNRVADGGLMSWVYKLKSIQDEFPVISFYRDLTMFARLRDKGTKPSKTAAALNYWLTVQRHDLPLEITKLSFASYNIPITRDGTLPFKAFGRPLNIRRLHEKGIPMLICYGEQDALVEKSSALAPLDYIPVEVTPFPKGHVAIATSWSHPGSAYALHTRFGEESHRGPVRFQLDIEQESMSDAA